MVVNPPESPVHSTQDPNEPTFDDDQLGSDSQQTVPENPHADVKSSLPITFINFNQCLHNSNLNNYDNERNQFKVWNCMWNTICNYMLKAIHKYVTINLYDVHV